MATFLLCPKVIPENSNAKFYSQKDIMLMETSISDFNEKFYIPEIQNPEFYMPHVRLLGTNHRKKNAVRPSNAKVHFNVYCVLGIM